MVKELDLIIEEIDTYIQAEHSDDSRFQNWKEEFYFEALVPYDEELNQFEIAFGLIQETPGRSGVFGLMVLSRKLV